MSAFGAAIAQAALRRRVPPPGASGRVTEVGLLPVLAGAGALLAKAGKIAGLMGLWFAPEILEGLIGPDDAAKDIVELDWLTRHRLNSSIASLDAVAGATLTGSALAKWTFTRAAAQKIVDEPATVYEAEMAVRELDAAYAQLAAQAAPGGADLPTPPGAPLVIGTMDAGLTSGMALWLLGAAAVLGLAWWAGRGAV